MSEESKVGVFVCNCGVNIAGTIDVKEVIEYSKTIPHVVEAKEYVFMCSAPGQDLIKESVKATQCRAALRCGSDSSLLRRAAIVELPPGDSPFLMSSCPAISVGVLGDLF